MKNMFFWAVVAYVITLTVAFSVKQLFVPRPITVPLINIYEHPEFDLPAPDPIMAPPPPELNPPPHKPFRPLRDLRDKVLPKGS